VTITLGDPNQSSFSGDCAGTADCVLTMDDDKDVVVNWTQ
jgi:hypothetical protein